METEQDWVVTIEGFGSEPDGDQLLKLLPTAQRVSVVKGSSVVHELAIPLPNPLDPLGH